MGRINFLLTIYRETGGFLVKVAFSVLTEKMTHECFSNPMEETSRRELGKLLPESLQELGPVVEAERIYAIPYDGKECESLTQDKAMEGRIYRLLVKAGFLSQPDIQKQFLGSSAASVATVLDWMVKNRILTVFSDDEKLQSVYQINHGKDKGDFDGQ